MNPHPYRLRSPQGIGVNRILQFCNWIVACLLLSRFLVEGIAEHPYVDRFTVVLALALCLQTHLALHLEKRNPDPFVLIMAYLLTFFYSLRIFTLALYPVQDVFLRYAYGPAESNNALLYVLVANVFIYAGFYWVKLGDSVEINTIGFLPNQPQVVIVLFVLSVLFGRFGQNLVPEGIAQFTNLIFRNFLTPDLILLALATLVIVFRKSLPASYIKFVWGGAVVLLLLQTLAFSRSGLLTLFDNVLIVMIALIPMVRLPWRRVVTALAVLPFLIPAAFMAFSISTTSRMVKGDYGTTLSEQAELAKDSRGAYKQDQLSDSLLGEAFARAGYFDFTAEIIANRDRYSGVFTAKNYLKSIVDNVLTPGFDIFDQPRISNTLKYADNLEAVSKKHEITAYHSDQFGIYAEMYNIFGYASFLLFGLIAILFKKAYRYKGALDPLAIALNKLLWVLIFYRMIKSFGLDWLLADFAILLTTFLAFWKLFRPLRRLCKLT